MLETSALQEMGCCSPGLNLVIFLFWRTQFSPQTCKNFTGQTGHKSSGELRAQPPKLPREADDQGERGYQRQAGQQRQAGHQRQAFHQRESPRGEGDQLPALPDWEVEDKLWRR